MVLTLPVIEMALSCYYFKGQNLQPLWKLEWIILNWEHMLD